MTTNDDSNDPPQPPPKPLQAQLFGKYRLMRILGSGGMAEVWLARRVQTQGRHQKYAAVKFMLDPMVNKSQYAEMFRREAELSLLLNHANIVQVFDHGEANGRGYMVMEWVDGTTAERIRDAFSHEPNANKRQQIAAYVVAQLLHALAYAHDLCGDDGEHLDIVHRDISPHNLLVSNQGDVKLTDFGIAHVSHEMSSGVHLKGKIRYMAPEQANGNSRHRGVDLYAAGAILHELIEGAKYRGDAPDDRVLTARVLEGAIPPLSQPIHPALEAVRVGLLHPNHRFRFSSAVQALQHLRRWPKFRDMKLELGQLISLITGSAGPRTGFVDAGPAPLQNRPMHLPAAPKRQDEPAVAPVRPSLPAREAPHAPVRPSPPAPAAVHGLVPSDWLAQMIADVPPIAPPEPTTSAVVACEPDAPKRRLLPRHKISRTELLSDPLSPSPLPPHRSTVPTPLAPSDADPAPPFPAPSALHFEAPASLPAAPLWTEPYVAERQFTPAPLAVPRTWNAPPPSDHPPRLPPVNPVAIERARPRRARPLVGAMMGVGILLGSVTALVLARGWSPRDALGTLNPTELVAPQVRSSSAVIPQPDLGPPRTDSPEPSTAMPDLNIVPAPPLVIAANEPSEPAPQASPEVPPETHASISEPKAPSSRTPRTRPSRASLAKLPSVTVHIRIHEFSAGKIEMKIGPHRLDVDPFFDGLLSIGRHRVRWRPKGSNSWKTSNTVEFVEGQEYMLHVSPSDLQQEVL